MYKVLLVDDEILILNGLRNIIDWEELELSIEDTALNGEDALNKFRENPVDIIITDISMPKLNGLELIEEIKKINSSVKFIILSGYDDFNYARNAIKLGIENYILKPINEDELKGTLENIVSKINSNDKNMNLNLETLEVLKENILYRWATDNISHYELEEREFILGIGLGFSYYSAAIIEFEFSSEIFQKLYKYIVGAVNKESCCTVFKDLGNNIILVMANNDVEVLQNNLRVFFGNLICSLREGLNVNTFISVGTTEAGYKNLPKSYNAAKKLKDYILMHGYNRVIYAFEKNYKKEHLDLDVSYLKEFKKCILSKDISLVKNHIDNTFGMLSSAETSNPSIIQNSAVKMILIIREIYSELNIMSLPKDEDIKEIILYIINLKVLDEIKNLIKNESIKLLEHIKRNSSETSPVIQQVIHYIKNNYQNEISIKTLSQKFNINPSYLGQVFHKEVGEPFSDYLTRIRNEKAKDMLLNTNLKINEIAQSVGYSDTSYFYRKFKEVFGISPNAMRSSKNYKL
ncbi:response regulator transcription factor [Clostridium sp. YIM B02515]|uniref:Stage 0 sporulation protein A homolog n=1 Tax=Clostridium rhizosphaerae TaxID=2803861 RepID=A0ABS1TAE2_9CLOT|nr:response regulator transcription factor [Clostridium rhizosphaerae]MBL4936236.1 response regulator transcription factor [Clostridium rhizosphaerae]